MSGRTIPINLAVIAAFGIFVPWRKEYDFLDALMIVCYALLPLLFVAPAIADFMTARRIRQSVYSARSREPSFIVGPSRCGHHQSSG